MKNNKGVYLFISDNWTLCSNWWLNRTRCGRAFLTDSLCISCYVPQGKFSVNNKSKAVRSRCRKLVWENWFHWFTGFPTKWRLRTECRSSTLMTYHFQGLGSTSYWLKQISNQSGDYPFLVSGASSVWNFCAPMMASLNIGCFLRLAEYYKALQFILQRF